MVAYAQIDVIKCCEEKTHRITALDNINKWYVLRDATQMTRMIRVADAFPRIISSNV